VLAGARVEGDTAIGLMRSPLPSDTHAGAGAWLMAPRLIELCFQTAALWEIKSRSVLALPMALTAVRTYRQLAAAAARRLYCVVNALEDGAAFDALVMDETGAVYVQLSGYRTVPLPGKVTI
jgi:hypothetical protein